MKVSSEAQQQFQFDLLFAVVELAINPYRPQLYSMRTEALSKRFSVALKRSFRFQTRSSRNQTVHEPPWAYSKHDAAAFRLRYVIWKNSSNALVPINDLLSSLSVDPLACHPVMPQALTGQWFRYTLPRAQTVVFRSLRFCGCICDPNATMTSIRKMVHNGMWACLVELLTSVQWCPFAFLSTHTYPVKIEWITAWICRHLTPLKVHSSSSVRSSTTVGLRTRFGPVAFLMYRPCEIFPMKYATGVYVFQRAVMTPSQVGTNLIGLTQF